jgi:hypothetical protein
MTLPEMQITDETSVAGYANYMLGAVQHGVGQKGVDGRAAPRDLQVDYTALKPLVTDPAKLVDAVNARLFGEPVNATLRSELVPPSRRSRDPGAQADGSNQALIDKAKTNRLWAAVAMPLVTPEFIVQK